MKRNSAVHIVAVAVVLGLGASSYAFTWDMLRRDTAKIKQNVIQQDPSFAEVLAVKERVRADELANTQEYTKKKDVLEAQLNETRAKLLALQKAYFEKLRSLDGILKPYESDVTRKINYYKASLRDNEKTLRDMRQSQKSMERMLARAEMQKLSSAERARWQKGINDLQSTMEPLAKQVAYLKQQVSLEQEKLLLLREK